MKKILERRVEGEALSEEEARDFMLKIGQGEINPSQIASFLSSYWYHPIQVAELKGFVMAEAHQKYDVRGVQFHPEAYLTQHGLQMIKNWLK